MAETRKAHERRKLEGWFDKYIQYPGIDIGCYGDTLTPPDTVDPAFRQYDIQRGDGDAQTMADIPDETFMTVYASHILEHLPDPITAIPFR